MKLSHTKDLIENHEKVLSEVQQRLDELHQRMQSAVERAEKPPLLPRICFKS